MLLQKSEVLKSFATSDPTWKKSRSHRENARVQVWSGPEK
jgi:hypothetical protein